MKSDAKTSHEETGPLKTHRGTEGIRNYEVEERAETRKRPREPSSGLWSTYSQAAAPKQHKVYRNVRVQIACNN